MVKKYFDDITEEILSGLEQTQKQFWNISRVTAEFLYTLIKAEKAKNVIEVGTSNGYSGIWLGNAVKSIGGHLTTIQFWDKRLDIAKPMPPKARITVTIAWNFADTEIPLKFIYISIAPTTAGIISQLA